jgi:NAD(P)-dependent dehydrogenase (short-subunit alcohol dehydrogenase family)
MNSNTHGSVTVVTGGASGIGEAIVRALLARGDLVIVLDLSEPSKERARQTYLEADVGDEASIEHAFATLDERFGGVDALVNCAGIDVSASILETSLDDWNRVNRVNAAGTFLTTRAAAARMIPRRSGAIVSISSINAHLGWRHRSAYSASKGAVEAFCRAAAAELGQFGIRVNVVAPGSIDTPMWGESLTAEARAIHGERAALGFVGEPDDIAGAVAFLTSDEARYITGVVIPVCGGRSTIDYLPRRG